MIAGEAGCSRATIGSNRRSIGRRVGLRLEHLVVLAASDLVDAVIDRVAAIHQRPEGRSSVDELFYRRAPTAPTMSATPENRSATITACVKLRSLKR